MVVDHDELAALVAQAESLAQEATAGAAQAGVLSTPPAAASEPRPMVNAPPDVARLLKIRVPVVVQLASRWMSVADVRKLSLGMIIEFSKSVDGPLDLLINNHPIGEGEAVKVGEHFGLRVSAIRDAATRIRSMGK